MSINNVINALAVKHSSSPQNNQLVISAEQDFRNKVAVGDVLKGKVLRQYESGRYGVSFNQKEVVVDSAITLNVGEALKARVVGVNEKIHLQRVLDIADESRKNISSKLATNLESLNSQLARYQLQLSTIEFSVFQQLNSKSVDPELMLLAAAVVKKLGLSFSKTSLTSVYAALNKSNDTNLNLNTKLGPEINIDVTNLIDTKNNLVLTNELATSLSLVVDKLVNRSFNPQLIQDKAKVRAVDNEDSTSEPSFEHGEQTEDSEQQRLGQWILNVQQEGAMQHRTLRMPVWFQGKMLELDLAMFADKGNAKQDTLASQRAVISISPEQLGPIEVEVNIVQKHVSVQFNTEKLVTAEKLSEQINQLVDVFQLHSWAVNDISYQQKVTDSELIMPVVKYHLSTDSLDRLI